MDKIEKALQRTRDTKACVIGEDASKYASEMFTELFGSAVAVIVADSNTWEVAGKNVETSFANSGIRMETPFVFTDKDLYAEWTFVQRLMARLSSSEAVAVAVGSGVINDLVKYVSGQLGRKYMCVCTACSMDGYTSFGASITKDGNKQTFDCPAPLGVIVDTSVAAAAPGPMAASGYADLIAKVPAAADWMIADAIGAEKIDDFALSLVQDGLKESLSDPASITLGDIRKTEGLARGLLMSGFAMQAIKSSRPASGTEHQFSHFWDMDALSYPDGKHVSHGFKVGIGTIISTFGRGMPAFQGYLFGRYRCCGPPVDGMAGNGGADQATLQGTSRSSCEMSSGNPGKIC
ncbi:MAG: sn-glycerol-1-phosphate dehydrogenase [Bacteroidales bacterium]|nr:sn-glycerol-1-phosphate dehydrogenase [Bacteroidales bacterium]